MGPPHGLACLSRVSAVFCTTPNLPDLRGDGSRPALIEIGPGWRISMGRRRTSAIERADPGGVKGMHDPSAEHRIHSTACNPPLRPVTIKLSLQQLFITYRILRTYRTVWKYVGFRLETRHWPARPILDAYLCLGLQARTRWRHGTKRWHVDTELSLADA